ncbi:MAG: TerB family tellurite resistance protein [Myxococcota bacterium]
MAIWKGKRDGGLPKGAPQRLADVVRGQMPDADDVTRRVVTAVAGLLACVAYADREYAPTEERAVRAELGRVHGLGQAGVEAVCGVLREDIVDLAQVGDQVWTRELKELGERELRVEVLDALVELAAADHELSLSEVNYLRRLTTALGLTQADYVALQSRHRDKLSLLR